MTNPTSTGVGTGTAVLDDYSVLNQATSDFFKTYKADKEKAQAKKDAQAAERKKAEAQLKGSFGEYDPDKMRVADKKVALQRYNDIVKKYEGRYAEMVNGGPLLNEYNDDMANYRIFVSNSVESNNELKDFNAAIHEPDSGYSPEKIKAIDEYSLAEGSTMQGLQESGLYDRDQVIGDPLDKLDNLFKNKGETELYNIEKGSYPNAKGQIVEYDKQNWLDESQALPKVKNAIQGNPELRKDLDLMYPGMDFDDQVQRFYDTYKENREDKKNYYDIGRAPEDRTSGTGGPSKKFELDTYESGLGKDGVVGEGITIAKVGNQDLKPMDLTVSETKEGKTSKATRSVVPVTIEYDRKNNSWYLNGYSVKSVYNTNTEEWETERGNDERIKMSPSGQPMKKVKARFNIKGDLTDWYEKKKAGIGNDNVDLSNAGGKYN